MSTLANSFLDDLDDLGDSDEESVNDKKDEQDEPVWKKAGFSKQLDDFEESDEDDGDEIENDPEDGSKGPEISPELQLLIGKIRKGMSIENIITIRNSSKFKALMIAISEAEAEAEAASDHGAADRVGPHEEDQNYKMLVACNKMVQDINEEFDNLHRYAHSSVSYF